MILKTLRAGENFGVWAGLVRLDLQQPLKKIAHILTEPCKYTPVSGALLVGPVAGLVDERTSPGVASKSGDVFRSLSVKIRIGSATSASGRELRSVRRPQTQNCPRRSPPHWAANFDPTLLQPLFPPGKPRLFDKKVVGSGAVAETHLRVSSIAERLVIRCAAAAKRVVVFRCRLRLTVELHPMNVVGPVFFDPHIRLREVLMHAVAV